MSEKKAILPGWLRAVSIYALPPLAVMFLMLGNFFLNKLYPFGNGTVAWCDMTQQVIPLLCDLKDILTGKQGIFLNFANAGGMNMWAVIFFFVSSPLSFLVLAVDRVDMVYFVNILVMLKLMLCALTTVVYFRRRLPRLGNIWPGIFAVTYALGGYAMLYFQNCIWLDMMYLFPLLLTAFGEMLDHRRLWPYVAVLAAMMVVNYYIGYMVVLYILLFMALFCLRYSKEVRYANAPMDFCVGSLLAALLSAAVWLPSFLQYLTSGRRGSLSGSIESVGFFARFQTTLPTIMHSVLVIVILVVCLLDARPRTRRTNLYLILLVLTCIPLYIEPINLMWHTGSYMAFPSRYGFIPQFLMTITAAMLLCDTKRRPAVPDKKSSKLRNILLLGFCAVLLYAIVQFLTTFVSENRNALAAYPAALWANDRSFHMIIKMMLLLGAVYLFFYLLFRHGKIAKEVFTMLCAILVGIEGYCNMDIYMSSPHYLEPDRAVEQREVMDLSGRIDDQDGFYRVHTSSKIFDVNLVGAMGYNSISHYTSLTSEEYMFMMKRLGYSSYWMEVGSYGGTELTDAIFSMKYTITDDPAADTAIYSNETYAISPDAYYLPLGVISSGTREDTSIDWMERCQIQQFLYANTIGTPGDEIVTRYTPEDPADIARTEGMYTFERDQVLNYTIDVQGHQSLYFDCFKNVSNALREDINDCFSVTVGEKTLAGSYPNQAMNGLLPLGTFQDESVTVTVKCLKDCECPSFGIFGLDLEKLSAACEHAATVGFTQKGSTLKGQCTASAGDKCMLSIPYSDGLKITVNGRSVPYQRAFEDMVIFALDEGDNEIRVTGRAKGMLPGILLTLLGVVLCVLYKRFHTRLVYSELMLRIAYALVMMAGIFVLLMIYVMPLWINLRVVRGI